MSRNNMIIAGIAVVLVVIVFAVLGVGGDETSAPDAEAEAPEAEATE